MEPLTAGQKRIIAERPILNGTAIDNCSENHCERHLRDPPWTFRDYLCDADAYDAAHLDGDCLCVRHEV